MKKILITTSSFGKDDPAVLEKLKKAGFDYALNPYGRKLTEAEVSGLLAEMNPVGMIAGVEPLTRNVLEQAAGLRVISRCGIGLDSVDLEAAKKLGIRVLNTPDAPTLSVAELTVALMLNILRKIPVMDSAIKAGRWNKQMGRLLSGKTVGLIGCGRIGSSVAKLLSGFQCELLGYDPHIKTHSSIKLTDMDSLLKHSDIISIHVPYSRETRNLLNEKNIASMKKGAVVINTSRGGIIDEEALCRAIKEGRLGGAGLDCFLEEPYKGELAGCEQAVLTCHIGSYAKESRIQMERESIDNLLQAFQDIGKIA